MYTKKLERPFDVMVKDACAEICLQLDCHFKNGEFTPPPKKKNSQNQGIYETIEWCRKNS